MSRLKPLNEIANHMRTSIELIREFSLETDTNLAAQLPKRREPPFTEEEQEELREVSKTFLVASKKSNRSKNPVPVSLKLSDQVMKFVLQSATSIKRRTFMAEMALAYLVSHLETFIKDYVRQILVDNPTMLRSGTKMTHEEVLSHRSMKALRIALAESEVDALGYGSIDDIATYFKDKMNISLSGFSEWQPLRESIYRRNLIVHNQGRVNDIYRRKVQYTGKAGNLSTDMAYVATASATMLRFIEFVHSEVLKKFKLNEQ